MRGPFLIRLLLGLRRPKRKVRGVDVSGRVDQVRRRDSRFKVGDEVFGLGSGSFAEYVACDEKEIVHKPASLPFPEAATLGVAAFTAFQAVRTIAKVRPGQRILVTAAGSGVGVFVVQLAKWMGAHVTAVTSTKNVELARSLGADSVIDYTKVDFTREPERYDAVIDISGRAALTSSRRVVLSGGTFVVVGSRGGIGHVLATVLLRRVFRYPVRSLWARPNLGDLKQLGQLAAEGYLRAVIDRTYSLSEVPRAMAYAEEHRVAGKIVIKVA